MTTALPRLSRAAPVLIALLLLLLFGAPAYAGRHALELTLGPDLIYAANNATSTERLSATAAIGYKAARQMSVGIELEADPATDESGVVAFRPYVRLQAGPNDPGVTAGMIPFFQLSLGEVVLPVARAALTDDHFTLAIVPKLGAEFPVADRWSTYVLGSIALDAEGGITNTDTGASFGVLVKLGRLKEGS